MESYRSVFGGQLDLATFADSGTAEDPAEADLVMHGHLDAGGGLTFMGSDAPQRTGLTGQSGVAVALSGGAEDEPRLRGWFEDLAAGGTITQPLTAAPWGGGFGMLTDRFGTAWMVNIGVPGPG